MSLDAYTEITVVSPLEDQKTIHSMLQQTFQNAPKSEFNFLNIYKELPITSSGTILELNEHFVEFSTSATQLAAMGELGEVLLKSDTLNATIIGKVKELDSRREQVTLGEFRFAEFHAEKRNSVRVKLKCPMNVQMVADGKNLSGVIRDISLGGACVSTFTGAALEQASSIGLRIKLLQGADREVVEALIPCRLIRINKNDMQAQCAMAFNHTPESEQVLSAFIYQRQLEIIKELKEKR